jgi:hypothetical protein
MSRWYREFVVGGRMTEKCRDTNNTKFYEDLKGQDLPAQATTVQACEGKAWHLRIQWKGLLWKIELRPGLLRQDPPWIFWNLRNFPLDFGRTFLYHTKYKHIRNVSTYYAIYFWAYFTKYLSEGKNVINKRHKGPCYAFSNIFITATDFKEIASRPVHLVTIRM